MEKWLTKWSLFDDDIVVTDKLDGTSAMVLYDKDGNAVNHNPEELIQTQDLPPFYTENSCIYLFSKDSFKIKQHRVGTNPYLFEIDPEEALDIDTTLDFNIVDCLMRNSRKLALPSIWVLN